MSFAELGLTPSLLKAVERLGYTDPTPIQEQAIPVALTGGDILGCAQTGTGKTAAFILPALQLTGHQAQTSAPRGDGARSDDPHARNASARAPKSPILTLVVTPTRELAGQIEEVAVACSRHTGQHICAVYGGVGYDPQVKKLRKGVDLLVATPGRLLDLEQRGDVDLSQVQILVLDEADRLLDMGFWPDVRRIMNLLPTRRQNMLFSATLSNDVMRVAGPVLDNPTRVEVAPASTPIEAIDQALYPVAEVQKTDLLVRLLEEAQLDRVLVFTRTKHRADRVCRHLERARIKGAAIHSNRTQSQRQHALDGFKNGTYRVLVATDIVARGIDVDKISHVINYDLPSVAQDYVHRIGRTARAGATGTAISFLAAEQVGELREIEVMLGAPLPCRDLDGFEYMQRLVPNPERVAKKAKPRLVYNGSARRRR
jgi:ATP-dependent RNA helicase RhlE